MMVSDTDDLMLITAEGTVIRMHVDEISVLSRVTQGVTLMRTSEENRIVSLARLSAAIANEEPDQSEEETTGTADEEAAEFVEDASVEDDVPPPEEPGDAES